MQAQHIEIFVPTPADGGSILEVVRQIDLFIPEDINVIEELWTEFATKGDAGSWYHFIATRNSGQILGFACYGQRPLTEGTYDLYWIAVDKRQQGKGVGKLLLREVEDRVRQRGGRLLIAETAGKPEFEPTRQFYFAAGYKLEARIRDFYRPGDDLVTFTKRF